MPLPPRLQWLATSLGTKLGVGPFANTPTDELVELALKAFFQCRELESRYQEEGGVITWTPHEKRVAKHLWGMVDVMFQELKRRPDGKAKFDAAAGALLGRSGTAFPSQGMD